MCPGPPRLRRRRRNGCAGCAGCCRCRGRTPRPRSRGRARSDDRPGGPRPRSHLNLLVAGGRARAAAAGAAAPAIRSQAWPRAAGRRPLRRRLSGRSRRRTARWRRTVPGSRRQSSSSALAPIRASHRGGATGTASTTRAAPCARAIWQAARAVDPVAIPSSTTTAMRPASGCRGRPPRKRRARRSSSARSRASTAASSSLETPVRRTTSRLMTRTPSSPMAPMPSSGWNGTPSLRTTMTSSGAPRARATSKATGTPPRGRPRTTTCLSRRSCSLAARRRPASARSAKTMATSAQDPPFPAVPASPGTIVTFGNCRARAQGAQAAFLSCPRPGHRTPARSPIARVGMTFAMPDPAVCLCARRDGRSILEL